MMSYDVLVVCDVSGIGSDVYDVLMVCGVSAIISDAYNALIMSVALKNSRSANVSGMSMIHIIYIVVALVDCIIDISLQVWRVSDPR